MKRRIRSEPIAYRGSGDPVASAPAFSHPVIETDPVQYTGLAVTPLNGHDYAPGRAAFPVASTPRTGEEEI